jgi:hypothetical protein
VSKDGNNKFNWRGFTSIVTGLSFIGMSITGIVLFVVPPGRIANWTGWRMWGLTKHQWIGVHIWFSVLFMAAAIYHTYLNWRVLLNYFKDKISKSYALRWEWISALSLCVLIGVATLADIKPFSSLLDWNEAIKHSWDEPNRRAPIPHAELLTLGQLAEQVEQIDVETMIANLKAKGIVVESYESVVGQLAKAHNISPIELYDIAIGAETWRGGRGRGGHGGAGQGQRGQEKGPAIQRAGQMTLRQYCTQTGLDLGKSIEKLQKAGLSATAEMTIREIADSKGLHPSEVRGLLE